MKFNWGHGIVVAFALFMSFVIYAVVTAFRQDVDLVSETYYKDELVYQERIDEKSNLAQSGLELKLEQTSDALIVKFPQEFSTASGDIHLFHPSREIFDKHFDIDLNDDLAHVISKENVAKGRFKVKISWATADSTNYYQEAEVFLQ